MLNRKLYWGILAGLMAIAIIAGIIILYDLRNQNLEVIFLDVGQGDAILVQEGSQQLLIDGGKDGRLILEKLGKYMPFWDRGIEAVIETHPDQDHIGGLVDIFEDYRIGSVIKTKDVSGSQTFRALEKAADVEKVDLVEAKSGTKIKFPSGAEAEIVFPSGSVAENSRNESNADSVVVKIGWNDEMFLLAGDLPSEEEKQIISGGKDLQATVLKVAHHGSKYSTGDEFLDAVSPDQAIISVGAHNVYGHPSPETLERLKNHNVEILRTDEKGDIIYECKAEESKCQLRSN